MASTRPLLQAHHNTLGYLCAHITLNNTEQVVLEPRPLRYIVINSDGVQPASTVDAQHVIKLDLLDVVLRARFLGVGDVDLLNMLTTMLGEG